MMSGVAIPDACEAFDTQESISREEHEAIIRVYLDEIEELEREINRLKSEMNGEVTHER